jgi:F0F1-type ATP synthase assembly protein I
MHAPEGRVESMTTRATDNSGAPSVHRASDRDSSTETKSSYKTTELIVYVVASALVLIAGLIVDGFNATETWRYFTYLSIGYMISRGLAKSGSREPYSD